MSAVRVTGVRSNSKAPYPAYWESRIECDFLTLLEFDPSVCRYYTQPMTFEWTDSKGKLHTYTPDVLIVWNPDEHGRIVPNWLVDMKSANDLIHGEPDLHEKLREARKYAQDKGWVFKDITELQIRSPLLDNVKFFQRHLRAPSSPEVVETARLIIQRIFAQSSPTPATVLATFPKAEHNAVSFVLLMLIARREVLCDLKVKLQEDTTILSLPEKYTEEWLMKSIIFGEEAKKLNGRKRSRAA